MLVLLSEGVLMVSSLSDTIHEPAGIREVCQWSAAYQIASVSQQISVRCPCLLDAGMSREVASRYP